MSRTFTRAELTSTITTETYNALPADDRDAFDRQLTAMWADDYAWQARLEVAADYDLIASRRRYEIGE